MQGDVDNKRKIRVNVAFVVTALCFALWGMAGIMMKPASHSLGQIFGMTGDASGDAIAFHHMYWAYLLLALPVALVVRRYGFKAVIVMGLIIFAAGSICFAPAAEIGKFGPFALGYTLMSIGLLALQTAGNPYAMTYGPRSGSLFRILLAQTANVIGWRAGYYMTNDVLTRGMSTQEFAEMSALGSIGGAEAQRQALWTIAGPYVIVGLVAFVMAIVIGATSFYDRPQDEAPKDSLSDILAKLWNDKVFVFGTLCQFAFVTAQILCWSGIIRYGATMLMEEDGVTSRTDATMTAMAFVNMGILVFGGFRLMGAIAAAFDKFHPAKMLLICGAAAALLCCGSLFGEGYTGMGCMIGISACMSIMYPTIYYLAMRRQNISGIQVGTTFQVLCIFGGLVARQFMPEGGKVGLIMALAMVLFVGIGAYGWWCNKLNVGQ